MKPRPQGVALTTTDFDFSSLREKLIVALVANDYLYERLVLKGGNALELVHKVVKRGSLDLDFSLEGDFEELDVARRHVRDALTRFAEDESLRLLDFRFDPKPELLTTAPAWWGGYQIEFKLIDLARADELARSQNTKLDEALRRNALRTGQATQERTFSVDISKHEYC